MKMAAFELSTAYLETSTNRLASSITIEAKLSKEGHFLFTDDSARIFYPNTLCHNRELNSRRFSCTSTRDLNSGHFAD